MLKTLHWSIANVRWCHITGDYEEAIEEHKTELTLSEIKDDRIGVAVANRKIGECYCSLQKFQEVCNNVTSSD